MYFNIVNINFIIIVVLGILLCNNKKNQENVNSKNEKTFLIISFFLLTFVMMFRYTTYYADYNSYVVEYKKSANITINDIITSKSPVSFGISFLLNRLTNNPQIYFMFTGFFIIYSFFRWINKHSDNKYLSVIAFVGLLYYSTSMNIVRQYFALAILLFGYDYLAKDKMQIRDIIKFLLICVIAFFTHSSAIIGIVWLFLKKIPVPKLSLNGVLIPLFIYEISNIIIGLGLNKLYSGYIEADSYGTVSSNALGIILPLMIFMITWLNRKKLIEESDNNKFLINSSIFNLSFGINSVTTMLIIARVAVYMSVFNILLIPKLVDKVLSRFNFRSRTILAILAILIYYIIMVYYGKVNYVTEFRFL